VISDEQLSEPERRIMSAARTGELVDLSVGDAEHDDPAHGATWDGARTVRAEMLIELLTAERTPSRPWAIRVKSARIIGQLDLEALELSCPLLLRGCRIDEPINLDEATAPAIRLPGCHLPGLSADQIRLVGNLEFNDGFTASGGVRLLGAHVGGQLLLDGARLGNPGGYALQADGITVDQDMFCGEGFIAEGGVRLLGAHIGGQLSLSGARLTNPREYAMNANRLTVDQSMFCRAGFIAEGEVHLLGAHIGGQLSLSGARLTNPGGYAMNANRLTVDQDMFCGEEFTAEGEVHLLGAHIGGQLSLSGASLNNAEGMALNLEAARVAQLMLQPGHRPAGIVNLTNARVGAFYDDQATWPSVLRLRGFTYESLENDQVGVRDRLRWLKLHPGGYTPQIYEQLADAYRRAGRAEGARKVGVAKQLRRRSKFNPFNWLLYLTVGYGYRTWLAAIWLAGLAVVGWWVFTLAHPGYMIQATPNRTGPVFHALAYTLDVLLPIVDLGQERAWTPTGWAAYWTWALIAVGWVLTTAVVAGLTGIFKRD
jgi:adhesin HecA-like repeat protein